MHILDKLPNLQTTGVECCERVNHLWSISTHNFVLQHGIDITREENPAYVEDHTNNNGWASLLSVQIPLGHVHTHHLTWAQIGNLDPRATVNRVLRMALEQDDPGVSNMTSLVLTLDGVYSTHGSRNWHGNASSAGGVQFWLNNIKKCQSRST